VEEKGGIAEEKEDANELIIRGGSGKEKKGAPRVQEQMSMLRQ
jgi:hypothetical protein